MIAIKSPVKALLNKAVRWRSLPRESRSLPRESRSLSKELHLLTPPAVGVIGFAYLHPVAKPSPSKDRRLAKRFLDLGMSLGVAAAVGAALYLPTFIAPPRIAPLAVAEQSDADKLFAYLESPAFIQDQADYALAQAQRELAKAQSEANSILTSAEQQADSITSQASATATGLINDARSDANLTLATVEYSGAQQIYNRPDGTTISVNHSALVTCTRIGSSYQIDVAATDKNSRRVFYGAASCNAGQQFPGSELGKTGKDLIGVSVF
jgi:hypothetical protein